MYYKKIVIVRSFVIKIIKERRFKTCSRQTFKEEKRQKNIGRKGAIRGAESLMGYAHFAQKGRSRR